jgi:hypothetical protein
LDVLNEFFDFLTVTQIKISLVEEALARYNSGAEEQVNNSRLREDAEPTNGIKLITRLNGQHEHKWKINRANPLSKVL